MIELVFVLLPHSCALDWAGPAEAFRVANQTCKRLQQPEPFKLRFVGPQMQTASSVGLAVAGIEPLPKRITAQEGNICYLFLLGSPDEHINLHGASERALMHWLRSISPQLTAPHRLVTICAGALYAAQAGLLAHAQVTTHHLELDKLRTLEPSCHVLANRVFVTDDAHGIYSSAGITTGIDLAVHIIAQVCGEAVAARVAQVMVMPLRRGLGDPELSPFLRGRAHLHAAVHRVQDAVGLAPQKDWTVPSMADVACATPRHLARLFAEHVGMPPLAYLQNMRLAVAEKALTAGQSVMQAAHTAGFSSDTQLRRAWVRFGRAGNPSSAHKKGT
jgi:transcriptional regulator GlxA family with amidase domain